MKTIKLSDRPHRPRATPERLSDILTGAMLVAVLLFARSALNSAHTAAQPIPLPMMQAVYLVVTATAGPTATPLPTPAPIVQVQQVVVTAEPQVIYVQSPPVTSQDAPGQAEAAAPDTQAAEDWYSTVATPPPGFAEALIDPSKPDAPACVGPTGKASVLCGGLTNAQAQTAIAGQR